MFGYEFANSTLPHLNVVTAFVLLVGQRDSQHPRSVRLDRLQTHAAKFQHRQCNKLAANAVEQGGMFSELLLGDSFQTFAKS